MEQAKKLFTRTIHDMTEPLLLKQMAWALVFVGVSVAIILANMSYLRWRYPDPPVLEYDFFLNLFPQTRAFISLSDLIGRAGALIIIYIMWEERFRRVPKLIFLLAAMYVLRSFAIILTPLGQIHPPDETYSESNFLAQNFYFGMFFSGHTASAFLQVFFIKGHWLRPYAMAIAIFEVIALLASHSHYSIDIFGGFFVAYFFVQFDFMCLVPKSLRKVSWMPWYAGEQAGKTPQQAAA